MTDPDVYDCPQCAEPTNEHPASFGFLCWAPTCEQDERDELGESGA